MPEPIPVAGPPPQKTGGRHSPWLGRLQSAPIGQWYRYEKVTRERAGAARTNLLGLAERAGIGLEATCRGTDLYYRVTSRPENANGQG